MDGAQSKLSPKDAGAMGIQSFKEIMPEQSSQRVLLEGLEFEPDQDIWVVTIGFDSWRVVPEPEVLHESAFSALKKVILDMHDKTVVRQIVREFRTVYLNARDGTFVKMKQG